MAQADVKQLRDKKLAECGKLGDKLDELKQRSSKEPGNTAVTAELHALKQQYAMLGEEYGELARMVALQAGAKNYRPPPT